MSSRRVLVLIPTYNEADNIELVVQRVRAAVPDASLLILDDNSPDGTGQIADNLVAQDSQVHVIHRPGKQGLGRAYLAGFAWGLAREYDVLVEMDADGSHQPEQLPRPARSAGARRSRSRQPVGSRRCACSTGRAHASCSRRGGNRYARVVLGLPLRDATGGYRAFRRSDARGDRPRRRALRRLLLPGRPRLARLPARVPRRRGADHVRRARARRQQDEPQRSCARRYGASRVWGVDRSPGPAPSGSTPPRVMRGLRWPRCCS